MNSSCIVTSTCSLHPYLHQRRCTHTATTSRKQLPGTFASRRRLSPCYAAEEGGAQQEPTPSSSAPPPPPPPPPSEPWRGDITWPEFKEKYLRPNYLPGSFLLGTFTLGLKTAADNFVLTEDPVNFIGCAVVSGLIVMAVAWIAFDFTDSGPGGSISSPRE